MTALVLDAGALIAVDRGDRQVMARLAVAARNGIDRRTSAIVVAEVWRDPGGRQAQLGRLLLTVEVRDVDEQLGRAAGILVGRANTDDPIDATVVLIAEDGDTVLTTDPSDLERLAAVAGRRVDVVRC
ncbi:MAG: hypothetical protein WEB13_00815 [Dehalococcoidia bacterium]